MFIFYKLSTSELHIYYFSFFYSFQICLFFIRSYFHFISFHFDFFFPSFSSPSPSFLQSVCLCSLLGVFTTCVLSVIHTLLLSWCLFTFFQWFWESTTLIHITRKCHSREQDA
mmetsp:Transcript_25724/g.51568  ORF Transcript_25724/g.51568 Transcript_25724/m.51568 type:complete len:113 (+) Transcript_25724:147-485(+)